VPSLILLIIAVPSFALLFKMDEVTSPDMTFKAVGNQWYWTYEYTSLQKRFLGVESYMSSEPLLNTRYGIYSYIFRLLDVTSCSVLPSKILVRVLITSTDVLHSWAVPSLGIKLDACLGRLNEVTLLIRRVGYYYGQCSEICDINYAFMSILIVATDLEYFYGWWTLITQKLTNLLLSEDVYWLTRDRPKFSWWDFFCMRNPYCCWIVSAI
jgi:cytochrome c oxidase subunit 2